jgi:hypothetical protein
VIGPLSRRERVRVRAGGCKNVFYYFLAALPYAIPSDTDR